MRHLLEIDDLTPDELVEVIERCEAAPEMLGTPFAGSGVACVFEKPSARTRNSTEIAVVQLGGHPVYIVDAEVGIDKRETAEDVARTLACYHRIICARVFRHSVLDRMAALDVAPVVNLLSDEGHPLQAIADVLTIRAELGTVKDKVVTYVGDANNVTRSLALAVGYLGGTTRVASPSGYRFCDRDIDRLAAAGVQVETFERADEALRGADVVYTDTWVSMGQEAERERRLREFEGFCVDDRLLSVAGPRALFMHCLPAHRGEEVAASVLDGPQSRIWPQAANRLRSARGVLSWIAEQNGIN